MSRATVELVESIYRAIEHGGVDAARDLFDESVLVEDPAMGLAQGSRGIRGLHAHFDRFADSFREFHLIPEGIWDNGDHVLVELKLGGEGHSGVELWSRAYHVHTIRCGQSVRLRFTTARDDALSASGIGP